MEDKLSDCRSARNRPLLELDTRNAKQVAKFTLGLGYSPGLVATTLVERCNVDRSTALGIIAEVQEHMEVM